MIYYFASKDWKKKKKSHVGCSEKLGDLEKGNEDSQGIVISLKC